MTNMALALYRKLRCGPFRKRNSVKTRLLILVICTAISIYLYRNSRARYLQTGRKKPSPLRWHGSSHQACVHPELPVWSKEGLTYMETVDPVSCSEEKNWVYTSNGKFYVSAEAAKRHKGVKCLVAPILNSNDSFIVWKPINTNTFKNGTNLISDAFSILCVGRDGVKYKNVHPCISLSGSEKKVTNIVANRTDAFNVFIYGFDSVSRNMFQRMLPKTHSYFVNELGGQLLEGYNIVGDGTTQALLPMFTGRSETELPESRRGKPGAKRIDELVKFVWKRYSEKGYVTQWGEDMAHIGTFQFRLLGFKEQPVDHYMRAYQLFAPNFFSSNNPHCLGDRSRHKVFIDWLKEGLVTNRGRNFFTFGFFSEYSHENNNPLRLADDDNVDFLKFLHKKSYLDNTILILMSDHGIRYGPIRETEQGKLEERMPYFGFRFPQKFKQQYGDKMALFQQNLKRLTTAFDVHETLLEIVDEAEAGRRLSSGQYRGRSLLTEIPASRTCQDAGIDPHWCACMHGEDVPVLDDDVINAAETVVGEINHILAPFTSFCHVISLESITRASVFTSNKEVLKFKGTLDHDGRVADLSGNLTAKESLLQIVFKTAPRQAVYEATVRKILENGTFVANAQHISRLNRYNDAPDCIAKDQPGLRPYCVCKN